MLGRCMFSDVIQCRRVQPLVMLVIVADYVSTDTWLTIEPMIQSILASGLDVIAMVKSLKLRYYINGKGF